MSVIRVNKSKDYTTMSNYHFKDKRITLKAKGLLSQMLSLPEDWDYSIQGLVAINKENEVAIKSALDELKDYRYLIITKKMPNETESGRIEYVYDVYEKPKQEGEKQGVEFLGVEFLGVENQGQYNTNNKITKNKNTKYNIYGEYKRVKLTEEQYNKLVKDYGKEFIDKQIQLLDEYVESNNNKNKYSNFNLVLRKSIRDNWFKNNKKEEPEWFYKNLDEEGDFFTDEERRNIKQSKIT